jgi:hypothetical protein
MSDLAQRGEIATLIQAHSFEIDRLKIENLAETTFNIAQ